MRRTPWNVYFVCIDGIACANQGFSLTPFVTLWVKTTTTILKKRNLDIQYIIEQGILHLPKGPCEAEMLSIYFVLPKSGKWLFHNSLTWLILNYEHNYTLQKVNHSYKSVAADISLFCILTHCSSQAKDQTGGTCLLKPATLTEGLFINELLVPLYLEEAPSTKGE